MPWFDALLDRSIVLSFDRTGFWRHRRQFDNAGLRDLTGQHVLVTGGTSGIGLSHASHLADAGAHVITWARDPERGAHAARRVGMDFTSVDLGDLTAVRDAAWSLPDTPLSAVVLNAGAMPLQRRVTPQGHELIWASQVLGHLLILRILRRRGLLEPMARIVWTSSGGMYTARLDLRDLTRSESYQRHAVYAQAKRAQVTLAHQLAERWPELWLASMHPGWVDTPAVAHSMPLFRLLTRPILRSWDEGADTLNWLVQDESPGPSGAFWFDREQAPRHLSRKTHPRPGHVEALMRTVFEQTDAFVEDANA